MLQVEWNDHILQVIGEDAVKRNQEGVIFWCNAKRWQNYHKRITFDKVNHQRISESIKNNLTVWFDFGRKTLEEMFQEKWEEQEKMKCDDGERFAELVVPARMLVEDSGYREWILRVIKTKELQGPVTLFPMVRLSNIHFNI